MICEITWQVGYHPDFESSRCLFIVRKDGEMVDFSYWKCIKGLIRKNYPLYADSFILRHFRRRRHNTDWRSFTWKIKGNIIKISMIIYISFFFLYIFKNTIMVAGNFREKCKDKTLLTFFAVKKFLLYFGCCLRTKRGSNFLILVFHFMIVFFSA